MPNRQLLQSAIKFHYGMFQKTGNEIHLLAYNALVWKEANLPPVKLEFIRTGYRHNYANWLRTLNS